MQALLHMVVPLIGINAITLDICIVLLFGIAAAAAAGGGAGAVAAAATTSAATTATVTTADVTTAAAAAAGLQWQKHPSQFTMTINSPIKRMQL